MCDFYSRKNVRIVRVRVVRILEPDERHWSQRPRTDSVPREHPPEPLGNYGVSDGLCELGWVVGQAEGGGRRR